MSELTRELRVIIAVIGGIFGMFLTLYFGVDRALFLQHRNSPYMAAYWTELKVLALHDDVDITYINPKVYDFFSLTPYFVAEISLSRAHLNTYLLQDGWSLKGDYYFKEHDGFWLKLSIRDRSQDMRVHGLRLKIEKIDVSDINK